MGETRGQKSEVRAAESEGRKNGIVEEKGSSKLLSSQVHKKIRRQRKTRDQRSEIRGQVRDDRVQN
jgi:hypothetical protein